MLTETYGQIPWPNSAALQSKVEDVNAAIVHRRIAHLPLLNSSPPFFRRRFKTFLFDKAYSYRL